MKEDGHEVLLVSNTVVDKEILKYVKFYLYDSRNQLFQEKYDDVGLIDFWKSLADGFYIHDVVPVLQKHGLSVMINLFNALLYAKSQGYTHFQRFEVDDLFGKKSREYIKQVPYVCANENKHGLFYYNEGNNPPDMSFHYFYCKIDEFLSKVPRLSNEQDYLNYLKQYHDDKKFRIVEVYVYESLKRNNDSKFLIKFDENAMTLDFPDTRWNTETSISSFDPKYGKCTTRLYYINEHNKETNTFNRGSSYAVYTYSYHSGSTFRKIVVEKIDGGKYEFIHNTEVANGWAWNEVFSDVKSISVYEDDKFLYREHVADCISYINLIRK
jgi:3-phenylpropionate/cinnamic acid dioxygenase small subunit